MADLLAAEPDTPIGVLQNGDEPPAVHLWADQEMVALMAIRHGLAAVPVVDDDGRFQGVVPPQTLAEILRAEHIEDIHRIVGISRTSERTLDAMRAPPVYQLKRRLPWLLVGLLGCVFATAVVARFEAELESRIAIAFFVPGLVYLAGAIGTQSEAIAVRGLSLTHLPMARLLLDEFGTGLLIGLALAVLSFPLIWLGFGDIRLALAVGLSLIAAGGTATATGLALPWIFWRAGWDPALGGGPMCTIIQDVLSLVVYFWMASWLLL